MSFGSVIKDYRLEHNLTQTQLAERAGGVVNNRDISRIEALITELEAQ